jgi:HSF-type DNA-binding
MVYQFRSQWRYSLSNDRLHSLLSFPISVASSLSPLQMMSLMKFAEKAGDPETYCVAWLPDGKSFVVRNPDDFTRKVLPKFFKATKFSSFTRKCKCRGVPEKDAGSV